MSESIAMPQRGRALRASSPPIVPAHDQGTQWVEWMGVRFQVPEQWYIVQHSVAAGRGSIALMDRYRQRMQVVWTPCRIRPNVEEIMSRYRDRSLPGAGRVTFRPLEGMPPWQGMSERKEPVGSGEPGVGEPGVGEVWFTRAAYFDEPSRRLIEVTLLNADLKAGDESLVARVLSSLTVVSDDRDATHWCGFGLDVTVPTNWRLVKTQIQAGDVSFRFRFAKPGQRLDGRTTRQTQEAIVRRLGMAELWYQGPEAYFRQRSQMRDMKLFPREVAGHAGVIATGGEMGPPLKRALGFLRRRRDLLWLCPHDNAVYHVLTLGPSDSQGPGVPGESGIPGVPGVKVRCCRWPSGAASS